MVAFRHQHPKWEQNLVLFMLKSPPGFKHTPCKSVLESLAVCQVSYFREVEGITIFHCKENAYGSSLAIRCYSLVFIPLLRDIAQKQSI